ncbi:MAG TPA: peptidoglycan-binding domain-containing protein, partial [Candidatus Dormibacteraeota bacterium]
NTGKAVQVLQIALARCNNADLGSSGADGIYGPITRNIVLFIQAANGIAADGVYGPQTLRVLRWPANTGGCWRLNP